MKIIYASFFILVCFQLCACSKNDETELQNPKNSRTSKIKITVGSAVFYEDFNTSYSYKIDDSPGLVTALGAGKATAKYELD